MKKTHEIILTVLFTALIAVFGVLHVALPDTQLSQSERRKLAQFPEFSSTAFFDGAFMQNLEKYLPDQFPFRESFRSIKAVFEKASGRLDSSDIYSFNGYLSKLDYTLNENSVEKAGKKLEKIREMYPDAQAYLAVIPPKDWYMSDAAHPKLDVDRLIEVLYTHAPSYKSIDIRDTLSLEKYYKTDSHWRQEMLDETLAKLTDSMGLDVVRPSYDTGEITGFRGVYVGQSAVPIDSESIFYLTNDALENASVTCIGAECNKIYTMDRLTDEKSVDMYDIFLGGAVPLVTIQNAEAQTDRTLILVRDSFGSSMTPLLVDYYENIYVVDLRYFSSLVLPQYVQATENTDLLVLLSTGVLNNSEMLKVQ